MVKKNLTPNNGVSERVVYQVCTRSHFSQGKKCYDLHKPQKSIIDNERTVR